MKNLAVTLLVLCCTLPLHAQLQKGTVLISAEGNYQKSLNDNGPTTNHTQSKAKNLNMGVSWQFAYGYLRLLLQKYGLRTRRLFKSQILF